MKLKCGRTFLTAVHVILSHQPSFSWPRCKQCFPMQEKEFGLAPEVTEPQEQIEVDAPFSVSKIVN